MLSSRCLCHCHGVAGFQKGQGRFGISRRRRKLLSGHVNRVLPAFEHIEFGVDGFFESLRLLPDNVLGDHLIAGADHRKIGFRSHDQTKRLKVGGDVHIALSIVVRDNFSQVISSSFGRDSPQNVSQILRTDFAWRPETRKFDVDLQPSCLAVHLRLAPGVRHKVCAFYVYSCGAATMAIVHSFGGA